MTYTVTNFKTKASLKRAIADGSSVTCYQPGPFGPSLPENGTVYLEGPHYPRPHTWYAVGTLENGRLVKVK